MTSTNNMNSNKSSADDASKTKTEDPFMSWERCLSGHAADSGKQHYHQVPGYWEKIPVLITF